MKAIISDIHANLESLCAVIKDIELYSVNEILCLGDIVGYGADPEACTDIIMEKVDFSLMGNHDYALIHGPSNFNPYAADIIYKTTEKMYPKKMEENCDTDCFEPDFYRCDHNNTNAKCILLRHTDKYRWEFIKNLPEIKKYEYFTIVHGSPLNHIRDYVYPDVIESLWNADKIGAILSKFDNLLFCGHTHIPCIITSDYNCIYPNSCDYRYKLNPEKKYIINTGSVGQPRDRDNRACYLLFDDMNYGIEWRRIPYDIETTKQKITKMCGKDNWCSQRLLLGR